MSDYTQTTIPAARQIEAILGAFDFDKVHDAMVKLDWCWTRDGDPHVPTTYEIIEEARRLLESLNKKTLGCGCGGFYASIDRWGWYNLAFAVSEMSAAELLDPQ